MLGWRQTYEAGKPVITLFDREKQIDLCKFESKTKAFHVMETVNKKGIK